MEWVLTGLLVWWWCSRRQRAARARQYHANNTPARGLPIRYATPIAVVDDYGYWLADGRLVRATFTRGVLEADHVEDADPLSLDDLPPALAVEILDALEDAHKDLEHPRSGQRGE